MKKLPYVLLALAILALAACDGGTAISAVSAGGMWLTRPDDPPPADTEHVIAEHENWCYETMGYAECYPHAQDVEPNRLINVDPPNRYPLTPKDYKEAVAMDNLVVVQPPNGSTVIVQPPQNGAAAVQPPQDSVTVIQEPPR